MEIPKVLCETTMFPACDQQDGNESKEAKDVRVLSIDKLTLEKIVLETGSSREVLVTKSESSRKISESKKVDEGSEPAKVQENAESFERISPIKLKRNSPTVNFNRFTKSLNPVKVCKTPPKVPAKPRNRVRNDFELIRNLSSVKGNESLQNREKKEIPKVEAKIVQEKETVCNIVKGVEEREQLIEDSVIDTVAKDRLEKSHSKIETLQQHLRTKINVATVETYKQKLSRIPSKITSFRKLDFNENLTSRSFDEEFLVKHNFDKQLKIEEKILPETADVDYTSDTECNFIVDIPVEKPKYCRKVSEVEKRWSGKFLEDYLKRNSSESSKSSYVEELESLSSHGSIDDTDIGFVQQGKGNKDLEVKFEECAKLHQEDSENTTSTIDSGSCYEARIGVIDDDIKNINSDDVVYSVTISFDENSVLKDSLNQKEEKEKVIQVDKNLTEIKAVQSDTGDVHVNNFVRDTDNKNINVDNTVFNQSIVDNTVVNDNLIKEIKPCLITSQRDAYANFIREFTMDSNMARCSKEEKKKKKSGLRRLLPGFFSPKDSRKDYKKEYRDRRKRDERYFCRYQQNGNYTRSPDSMNLNEDIKRNVQLDSSLNSSIAEDRLTDRKQEMLSGHRNAMDSSTPERNLQDDRNIFEDSRIHGSYLTRMPLSPVRHYDKDILIDRNVTRVSSDGKKVKQYNYKHVENERKCALERKHSLQESSQSRFIRNHAASGRISAPPSERFLIRPRAVHPMDRPLPAIPQKIEITNYENHEEIQKYSDTRYVEKTNTSRCSSGSYLSRERQNYDNRDCVIYASGSEDSRNTGQKMVSFSKRSSSKYSPSSSQRSGDYDDSTYTPNSSQKSEFSPGSSKSGEYYLGSPRTSNCTSPSCFNEKSEQTYESERRPYPVSPMVMVQSAAERIYDETPRSSFQENNAEIHKNHGPSIDLEVSTTSNLNGVIQKDTLPENLDNKTNDKISSDSRIKSPKESSKMNLSLGETREVTSPLTIITPENSLSDANIQPPHEAPWVRVLDQSKPTSPNVSIRSSTSQQVNFLPAKNVDRCLSPMTSSNQATEHSSNTFRSSASPVRRAQPSDQILIASPKREIYDSQNRCFSNRGELDCSNSPIPMVDSPSQVLHSKQSLLKQAVPQRLEYQGSHNNLNYVSENLRMYDHDTANRKCTSSPSSTCSSCASKNLNHPEPIYPKKELKRQTTSPLTVNATEVTCRSSVSHSSPLRKENNDVSLNYHGEYHATKRQTPVSMIQVNRNCIRNVDINEQVNSDRRVAQSPSLSSSSSRTDHSKSPQPVIFQQRQVTPVNRETPLYEEDIYVERNRAHQIQKQNESLYARRTPDSAQHGHYSSKQLSPSKKETMQHLEAFYWQQKALEAQKKSINSETNPARTNEPSINIPEVREAVYWQKLKKLDEEQQKRIYEQHSLVAKNEAIYARRKSQSPAASPRSNAVHRHDSAPNLAVQQRSNNYEQSYWKNSVQQQQPPQQQRSPGNLTGKPPIMNSKVQNQPVLIVRPQPAIQDRHWQGNFVRSDERRSLSLPRRPAQIAVSSAPKLFCEIDGSAGRKPPPIFKRGSLVSNSNSSVEYGSIGPKRVSFSNQAGQDQRMNDKKWPTKHGMALEPPTRKHKSEGDGDIADNVYGNVTTMRPFVLMESDRGDKSEFETEYDADKPLPPLPKESYWVSRRCNSTREQPQNVIMNQSRNKQRLSNDGRFRDNRKWPPGLNEDEGGNDVGEMQRIFQRAPIEKHGHSHTAPSDPAHKMCSKCSECCQGSRHSVDASPTSESDSELTEEEWNPNGKGRQSNDAGSACRVEGEGSNELSGSRRGAGSGGGVLGGSGNRGSGASGGSGSGRSRDEPRRHTLSGDHQPSLHHQQFNAAPSLHPLHPHHLPPAHGQYGTPSNRVHTTMDLEMGTKSRQRKSPLARGYPPPSSAMLFDDDPGIMSEVETSSTGFRRGGKQRSSLPVVRTPSKTLERPLGLVFLQYRNETKRALLPNEITSIDTVKALFVRSFPKQLTMEYLDSPHVKVYIHDSNKDMFYELEDLRSHLRDIRDRSVLRLFESTDGVASMPGGPLGVPGGGAGLPPHWEDQSYFSEPEFDSEYQHQHIHKSKNTKNSTSNSGGYYMGNSSTLPRGGSLLRAYSPAASSVVTGPNAAVSQPKTLTTPGGGGVAPAKPLRSYQCSKSPLGSLGGSARFSRDSSVSLYSIPDRLHGESGYMSSPERSGGVGAGSGRYPSGPYSASSSYEDPYYSQYSGTVTPVIDEEASDTELLEESYSLYGVKPPGRPPSGLPRSPFPSGVPPHPPGGQPCDVTRIKVEDVARQIANLTGLVQKVLTHSPSAREYLQVPAGRELYSRSAGAGDEFDNQSSFNSASVPLSDDSYLRTDVKPPKLGKDKSVSFEKSVSFSDEPPDMNSPKQHSPQHTADTKPTKPAIKSSTLPRMSSQERERLKPAPSPKPVALAGGQYVYRGDLTLTPEMYNQLRGLQKKAKDLRQEVRNLRRMSQAQAHTVRETIRDTFITIRAMLLSGGDTVWTSGDAEKIRLSREEDLYKQEMLWLEKDLTGLESTVEELRGNVINRKTRVNMSDVENMALILSKASKTVADLKVRFPSLQEGMKGLLSSEMEKVMREEKFLKEEPERLESALKRCKKLTGTLVTLKRLASVQEQRLPNAGSVEAEDTPPITPTSAQHSKATAPVPAERTVVGSANVTGGVGHADTSTPHQQRPENALDALLDELQTFSRPASQLSQASNTGSHAPGIAEVGRSASHTMPMPPRAPNISDIGRKGSIDSSTTNLTLLAPGQSGTLRRLHSYPSSSDTDTSPPINRLQLSENSSPNPPLPQKAVPPAVPERNVELLQMANARRVPPPPPPRTSSRSPLASPTSPQLPPRNPTGTLRRARGPAIKESKPPMALPITAVASITSATTTATTTTTAITTNDTANSQNNQTILSTSNSSSCESINSQEGLQKKGRQEQLEQRHQELLRKQKALQEQYARLQQLQRNASGLTTVPPAPPDLLKKTGSESNLLAKMGLGLSTASSGSLTSLTGKLAQEKSAQPANQQTTISKIYETDIL